LCVCVCVCVFVFFYCFISRKKEQEEAQVEEEEEERRRPLTTEKIEPQHNLSFNQPATILSSIHHKCNICISPAGSPSFA